MNKQKFSLQFSSNKKINFLVISLFASVAFAGILLLIPAVQNVVINLAEVALRRTLQNHSKWHEVITKGAIALLAFDLLVYILARVQLINFQFPSKNKLIEFKEKIIVYTKSFFILTVLYVLAFCTIFRANFNYIDDLGRVYQGYAG